MPTDLIRFDRDPDCGCTPPCGHGTYQTVPDPTPIPAEALEAAAKVAFRRYQSEYAVSPNLTWRDFVAEVHEFVEVVAPILVAAGRTAAADAIESHAESIGWYESSGTWAEAIEIARGADQ